jgi:imidazolonepropionase-like amidohydrolase
MKTLLLALLLGSTAGAEVTVFKGFTLIGNGEPLPNAGMIVTDGRITWVGPAAQMKAVPGGVVQDLAGRYVIPGIINLHGHVSVTSGLAQDAKRFFTREGVTANLALYASYGVTTVASLGTDQPLVYQIRDEQRSGRPRTTRIFTAGRGFTGVGGYPAPIAGMEGVPFEAATPEAAAAAVDELATHHPDLVKIWVDDHAGRLPKIPIEISSAIIRAAHRHGLKVVAHIFYLQDAKELAAAGIDGFAHSVRDRAVDDELIRLMKQHGTWQMAPTLSREAAMFTYAKPAPFLDDPFFTKGITPEVLAKLKSPAYQQNIAADPDFPHYAAYLRMAQSNLKRLADAGVRYGFGTDTGPPARFAGYSEHWEGDLMVEAGLTPAQVVAAATRSAAEFLGVSRDLGSLEQGKWADFVVLTANPLADIRNTRTIEKVYIAGNPVVDSKLAPSRTTRNSTRGR